MGRFGIQKTIWSVFLFFILIVGVSVVSIFFFYNSHFYKILYIGTGILVSLTQFAVAATNKTKRLNFFTKFLLKRYSR